MLVGSFQLPVRPWCGADWGCLYFPKVSGFVERCRNPLLNGWARKGWEFYLCACLGLRLWKTGQCQQIREQPPLVTIGNPCRGLSQPQAKAVSPRSPWKPGDTCPGLAVLPATRWHGPQPTYCCDMPATKLGLVSGADSLKIVPARCYFESLSSCWCPSRKLQIFLAEWLKTGVYSGPVGTSSGPLALLGKEDQPLCVAPAAPTSLPVALLSSFLPLSLFSHPSLCSSMSSPPA